MMIIINNSNSNNNNNDYNDSNRKGKLKVATKKTLKIKKKLLA